LDLATNAAVDFSLGRF